MQTGKLADLVLLDANPLQNIANTQRINAVIVNGRLMDRKTLDDLLAQMAAANATNWRYRSRMIGARTTLIRSMICRASIGPV